MKITKKIMALFLTLAMVLSFIPANVARADENYTVNFGTGTFTVDDKNVTVSLDGGSTVVTGVQKISYTDSIKLTGFDPDEMQVKVQASDGFNTTLTVSEDGTTSLSQRTNDGGLPMSLTFVVESKNNGGGSGGDNPGPENGTDFEFEMNFAGSDIIVSIEGREVNMESDKFDLEEYSFSGTVKASGTTDPNEANLMHFRPRYGDHPLKEVTINGTKYTVESSEVEISGRFGEEWDITVPGDWHYTIDGIADMDALVPRTIIWTNPDYVPKDEEDAEWVKNFSIEHGSARLIEMKDADGLPVEIENNGLKDGFGWVEVLPGYEAVFEFYPEYGYQLTEISLNETPMDASDVSNQFTISIPNDDASNVHFGAKFTKTEDVVKAKAEAVSDGSIVLGNELDGGSAQLLVNDVEVSSSKAAEFEEAAGEYEISDYLDIDLNQVFYKGKNDADDVWANEISELEKDATISLKLEEDVSADDVVIVHNVHDGSEFEVIDIDSYDADTNTITFKAKSFSNFAIATKAEEVPKPEQKTSTGTVSSEGILVIQDNPSIVAGMVHAKSDAKDDVEFRWVACDESTGAWFEISPWTKNNEWVNWTPDEAGNYVLVCYARVVGNEEKSMISKPVGVVYSKNVIKDICQIPYNDGYLIGFETKDNPNQSYQYEMLVMDLSLYAAGNPNCWILSTGRATVAEGNAAWITWKPEYGYYLTLFRVYDANGKLLDQQCYGFVNAY